MIAAKVEPKGIHAGLVLLPSLTQTSACVGGRGVTCCGAGGGMGEGAVWGGRLGLPAGAESLGFMGKGATLSLLCLVMLIVCAKGLP